MVWAQAAVMLKLDGLHNYFILHQIKYIFFFTGMMVSLERKLQSSIFET